MWIGENNIFTRWWGSPIVPRPMILADILSISIQLLLVLHVVVSLLLILVVLMQRPKQEGLGAAFGGGVADQVWGAQTTNVLQKGTVYLGTLFMVLSLVLAILIGNKNHQDRINNPVVPTVEEAPLVPTLVPGGGTIVEELELELEDGAGEQPTTEDGESPAPTEGTDGEAETQTPGTSPETEEEAPETPATDGEEDSPAETAPTTEGEEDKSE